MARERKRQQLVAGELNLTAMIDVAFQLLNFFIITQKPHDVQANLDVFTPSQESTKQDNMKVPNLLRITVYTEGYKINEREVNLAGLDSFLAKMASLDKSQTILIMCTAMSKHSSLVQLLDLCAKNELSNLSIISMN